ncbi:hypothetical protein CK556_01500 [Mesoplasma chauliocola]|uniref:Protein export membrane protein SecD/SecF C-terminal domain-containing protein n=1 Tax=Mesoplasma chauliocola TaxID=216427 RepID=A0A249SNG3_9MOLU|nr:protein translocase SecDF, variant type [Mesoplasma chauliocola]ASZ09031.1 hypothetical protein CK556_01500 [Mesoplasma chauliocola]
MNKKKISFKKISQVFCLILIISSLVISIVFSSISITNNTNLNTRYSGGYEALVEVYDQKQNSTNENSLNPNGDAYAAAESLQNKLSPFSDNTVDVKVVGKHRVSVRATKEQYQNNPTLFINAIEQDGGLLALTKDSKGNYDDILFNDETMNTVTGSNVYTDNKISNKIAISDIFGSVKYTPDRSESNSGAQNSPFLTFEEGANGTYLQKLTASSTSTEGTTTTPSLTLISSFETVLNNIREYFLQTPNQNEIDSYIEAYYDGIITPIIQVYTSSSTDSSTRAVIDDFFTFSYRRQSGEMATTSLISGDIYPWWSENQTTFKLQNLNRTIAIENLKALFYGQYRQQTYSDFNSTDNYQYLFTNNVNKYVIDPNATTNDFLASGEGITEPGKYSGDFKFSSSVSNQPQGLGIDGVAKILNKLILNDVLFNVPSTSTSTFNIYLNEDIFNRNFIMINDTVTQTGVPTPSETYSSRATFVPSAIYNGNTNELRVKMRSATIARTIEASISQTTQGFTFKVVNIKEFDPEITLYMLLASIIFLLILAIITMIFLLFAYKLLGLYTLIIAVTSTFIVFFAPTIFGIAIGIEIYTLIFVMIGLVLESCILTIEAFKKHLNKEKRSISESMKLSNRENFTIIVDSFILLLIPNLILFWVGSGSLKNFATVATVATAIILVLVVVIFRLLIWLTIKLDIFRKFPLLLPVDTKDINSGVAILEKVKLSKLEYHLIVLTNKEKVSSKELLKIKKISDSIDKLKAKIENKEKEYEIKLINKNKDKNNKLDQKIQKLEKKSNKKVRWYKRDWINFLKVNKEVNLAISSKQESSVVEEAKNKRNQNWIFNINRILIIVLLVFSVIGGVVAATVGPNYSNSFGKDNTYIVYGTYLNDFAGNNLDNVKTKIEEGSSENISNEFNNLIDSIENPTNDPSDDAYSAELGGRTVQFIFDNNLTSLFYSGYNSSSNLNSIEWGTNYGANLENNAEIDGKPYVQIELSNKTHFGRTRTLLYSIFRGSTILPGENNLTNESRGILGMFQIPFTAYGQILQICIAFGILLLILIVYILIRYKWTYYVALALAIVVVIAITTSLIIMFRVPISSEILVTMVSIVAFTIMSAIFILGKTKQMISAKTKNELRFEFNKEADAQTVIKHKVLKAVGNKKALNKKYKDKIRKLKVRIIDLKLAKKSRFYYWDAFKAFFKSNRVVEITELKKEIKELRKTRKLELKPLKQEIKSVKKAGKKEINSILSENKFVKQLFMNSLKFGLNRLMYISGFYLIFGLILAVTIPSIVGVGIALLIGVVVADIVLLTMSLPLLIWLEKRRIVLNYGRQEFILQTSVSHEEQIVKDIND